MKTFSALSSILVLGIVGALATTWLAPEKITLDLSDEDIHLYL
ncbi:hypothetical protein [Rufibacter sp. LB8]|nr:hypothetical protein [Rufibacter sp. LB8]